MEENVKTIEEQKQQVEHSACGCGSGGCGSHGEANTQTKEDLPIRFQILREGDRVVEFGSGTGNDVLAAAQMVGPTGKVVGIDMSEKNIQLSRDYSDQLKLNNVEFRHGNVEEVPLAKEFANIVLANCVFNLQENKQKVADEMYRICDHNGLVCISDFVTIHDIPLGLRQDGAELAGCIGGAENLETFMNYFRKTGFQNVEIVEMKKVHLPQDIFEKNLSAEDVEAYKDVNSEKGIFSVTLIGEKPTTCSPETCCCNSDKHKN
ncbi:MAG: methyltransferase domain-containing protein [Bacteroidales bacterium]|nr:methyltransferase domain-containing protein [Bacteroidales bacterium]MCF8402340.1 methyltransferase domain-containing protein [Bacteroidales bacterium]